MTLNRDQKFYIADLCGDLGKGLLLGGVVDYINLASSGFTDRIWYIVFVPFFSESLFGAGVYLKGR